MKIKYNFIIISRFPITSSLSFASESSLSLSTSVTGLLVLYGLWMDNILHTSVH